MTNTRKKLTKMFLADVVGGLVLVLAGIREATSVQAHDDDG